jgi:hypothetical protein
LFAFLAGITVEDFRFAVDRDAKRHWRRLEANGLVKTRAELPDWPVHEHDSSTIGQRQSLFSLATIIICQ